ncbi:MAG: metal ABC transporter solute-binding protein, Zn/Mn family [Halanaerobiales bacterium]
MFNKIFTMILIFTLLIIFNLGILAEEELNQASKNQFTIVTTFTILEDFARQVAGPGADVRVISPVAAEVHEWELTPQNFRDIEEADIIFYNGLNLEQWIKQIKAVVRPDVKVISLGKKCVYPTLPIVSGDYAGEADPHIWMDVMGAASYVKVIRDYLSESNPDVKEEYQKNAEKYISQLKELDIYLKDIISVIPEENRTLISSEAAFIYFADAYGFYHDGIWGTNTEEEGAPQHIMRIIQAIEKYKPKGIFWESTGSSRYAESISSDTGLEVFGPLYVDSVDYPETANNSYINIMKANAYLLLEVLKE